MYANGQPRGRSMARVSPGEYKIRRIVKPLVFVFGLTPFLWIVCRAAVLDDLGANPVEATNRYLGDWALRFLLISLAVSPAAGLTGWTTIARFRRMMGLFAYFYVMLHLLNYLVVDQFLDWADIWSDIVKRNFIAIGMAAVLLLTPLAITSTNGMVKRLGGKRWKKLHRLVYPAGILGVAHFYTMVKADATEPLVHGAILIVLLGYRALARYRPDLAKPMNRRFRQPSSSV